VFISVLILFLEYPRIADKSASGFDIAEPKSGDQIIAPQLSVYGRGAKTDGANVMSAKIVNLTDGSSTSSSGTIYVNSDGTWRFDYIQFPTHGSFRVVVDAIFGKERVSKDLVLHYQPLNISEAAKVVRNNIPEQVDTVTDEDREKLKRSRAAVEVLTAAKDLSELDGAADTMYRLGNYFLVEKEYEKAIEMYNNLLLRFPTHEKGTFNLARAYFEAGQLENGIKVLYGFERGHEKARSASLQNLATTYHALGRKEEALTILNGIIKGDPSYLYAYRFAAQISRELGHVDVAKRYYEEAISVGGKFYGSEHPDIKEMLKEMKDKLQLPKWSTTVS
jgi:hypothetical protein